MDDEALAPFVDALASSLIVMVLVCIFFLIQTSSAISSAAKLESVVNVDEKKHYSPIIFREIISADMEKKEFEYVVNFNLTDEFLEQIKSEIADAKNFKIIIESRDSEKKSAVNMFRFIQYLQLPKEITVKTEIQQSSSVLSKLRWEIN